MKQTMASCSLKPIQRSGVKNSEEKVIPHTNLGQEDIIWMSPRQFEQQLVMSNSGRSRWKISEH